jgi:hypothetical protein
MDKKMPPRWRGLRGVVGTLIFTSAGSTDEEGKQRTVWGFPHLFVPLCSIRNEHSGNEATSFGTYMCFSTCELGHGFRLTRHPSFDP